MTCATPLSGGDSPHEPPWLQWVPRSPPPTAAGTRLVLIQARQHRDLADGMIGRGPSQPRAGSVRTALSAPSARIPAATTNAAAKPDVRAAADGAPASATAAVRAAAAVASSASTIAPPRCVDVWKRPDASPFSPSRTPVMPCAVSGTNAVANAKPATTNAGRTTAT